MNQLGSPQQEDNNPVTPSPPIDDEITDEDIEERRKIADKLFVLISEVRESFQSFSRLFHTKIIIAHRDYISMSETEDQIFISTLTDLNETLGASQSTLDSYIRFSNSSPKFENFLNLIFDFVTYINAHRGSIFFRVNSRQSNYYYPLREIETAIRTQNFLFARLMGNLRVGGAYIENPPPSSRGSSTDLPYDPYRASMFSPDYYNPQRFITEKRRNRDFGGD